MHPRGTGRRCLREHAPGVRAAGRRRCPRRVGVGGDLITLRSRRRSGEPIAELLTPRDVGRLLRRHGLAPRKTAGQNFVTDPNTVRRIVAAAGLEPTDVVIEIGPGLGSLTLGLAQSVERVVAVEIDAGFVAALADVLDAVDNVEVVHADALRIDLAALVGRRPTRLVANLPYNTATPLVFHALSHPEITDAFVMVQREVAERWRADVGDPAYGAVSLKLRLMVDVRIELAIPRGVFHPVPNVDSSMVRLTRRPDAPPMDVWERLSGLADAAFAQRRKTLRNTLRQIARPDDLAAAASLAGIDLGDRAEELDADDLLRLDAALRSVWR